MKNKTDIETYFYRLTITYRALFNRNFSNGVGITRSFCHTLQPNWCTSNHNPQRINYSLFIIHSKNGKHYNVVRKNV